MRMCSLTVSFHFRYQDMVSEMKQIASLAVEQELSVEERNLLSVAYKNLVGARRASWRILQSVEQSEMMKNNEKRVKLIQKYRSVVEKELDEVGGCARQLCMSSQPMHGISPSSSVFSDLRRDPRPARRLPGAISDHLRGVCVLPEDEGRLPSLPRGVQAR